MQEYTNTSPLEQTTMHTKEREIQVEHQNTKDYPLLARGIDEIKHSAALERCVFGVPIMHNVNHIILGMQTQTRHTHDWQYTRRSGDGEKALPDQRQERDSQ